MPEPLFFACWEQHGKGVLRMKMEITDGEDSVANEPDSEERDVPELVSKALDAFEEMLKEKTLKPTLAEYLKLLEVAKECKQEEKPREITIRWIEPEEVSSEE